MQPYRRVGAQQAGLDCWQRGKEEGEGGKDAYEHAHSRAILAARHPLIGRRSQAPALERFGTCILGCSDRDAGDW